MSARYLIFAAMFVVGFILLKNWSDFTAQQYAEQEAITASIDQQNQLQIDNSGDIPQVTQADKTSISTESTAQNQNLINVEIFIFSNRELLRRFLSKSSKFFFAPDIFCPFTAVDTMVQKCRQAST